MVSWKLKSCPRCGGDMFIDKDLDGRWYEKCLQCSYEQELKSLTYLEKPGVGRKKVPVGAGKSRHKE